MDEKLLENNVDLFDLGWISFEEAKEVYFKHCFIHNKNKKVPFEVRFSTEQVKSVERQAFFQTFKKGCMIESRPDPNYYLQTDSDYCDITQFTDYQKKLITLYRIIDMEVEKESDNPAYYTDGLFNLKGSSLFNYRDISERQLILKRRGPFIYLNIDQHKPNTKITLKTYFHDDISKRLETEEKLFSNGPINFLVKGFFGTILPIRGVTEITNLVCGYEGIKYDKNGKHEVQHSERDFWL